MKNQKKGQLLLISAGLIFLSLIFIYSIETENYYITNSGENNIIINIKSEVCNVGKLSNGSFLDQRFQNFENLTNSYCNSKNFDCDLSISKSVTAPTNLSLLNYSHYSINFSYTSDSLSHSEQIIC